MVTNVTLSISDAHKKRLNIKLNCDRVAYFMKIAMEELALDEI